MHSFTTYIATVPISRGKHIKLPTRHVVRRAQKLCENRGGRPGLPVPDSPDGLCGRKATLNLNWLASGTREAV